VFTPAKPKLRYQLTFEGSGAWPTSVAFLGSGHRLAAGNQLGQIFVWDLPEKPPGFKPDPKGSDRDRLAPNVWPRRRLDGHTNEISRLVATPDGKYLASASYDRTVRVWPTEATPAGKADVVLDEEFRKREARRLGRKEILKQASAKVETQTACAILEGHTDWIYALGISGDGKRLISGDSASNVIVWELESSKPLAKWTGHSWNWIVAASLSPDGKSALVSEYRYKRDDFDVPAPALKLWDVAAAKETLDIMKVQFPKFNSQDRSYGGSQLWRKFVGNGLIASAIAPDGKLIAVLQGGETDTGKVHLLEAATGKLIRDMSGHMSGATDLLFTSDSKYVVSSGRDTTVRVCQVADGKEVAVLGSSRGGQFKDWFIAVAISPDERFFAAADIAGLVHVWEFEG
jgi:WD40 repeat protein